LSRLATAFVLGYHGCDKDIGDEAIKGDLDLLQSDQEYDWLGPGTYFWESDPQRALEWAHWKVSRGDYSAPYVIGAVIDLRNCLDLCSRADLEILLAAHTSFLQVQEKAGLPIPENKSVPGDPNADLGLRYLDCAVMKHLHSIIEDQSIEARTVESFDTVRAMFTEGGELYPGSGFQKLTHVQIAVRNNECIRGLFLPRPYPNLPGPV